MMPPHNPPTQHIVLPWRKARINRRHTAASGELGGSNTPTAHPTPTPPHPPQPRGELPWERAGRCCWRWVQPERGLHTDGQDSIMNGMVWNATFWSGVS